MKILFVVLIALLQFSLTGCGTMPQTAEEFRLAIPDAFMTEKESFEVARPFQDVGATFKKLAPKCLDQTIQTTSQTSTSYQVIVANWNPTVIVGKNKAELHLQRIWEQGVMMVHQEPPKGHFVMVVDAIPLAAKKTRIDIYRPSKGVDVIVRAIKGWASGKNTGCPDMTKN